MSRWLGLAAALWSAAALGAMGDAGWTLEQLMQSLAQVRAVDARFSEEKQFALLSEPLLMRGILRYRSPAYLLKQTVQPYPERFEVSEDWLTLETPGEGKRELYLRGYPELRVFVDSLRATLAGDLKTLRRHYRVDLQGEAARWTLRLEPLDERIRELVTAITIGGSGARILSVETLEADGDRSLMTIDPLDG